MKKSIILSIFPVLISLSSYANNIEPFVNINNGVITPNGEPLKDDAIMIRSLVNPDGSSKEPSVIIFRFKRFLGKTKQEIENLDTTKKDFFEKRYKSVKNKYNLLIYSDGYKTKAKGIYIFDKNDICIGYCFLTQRYIPKEVINEPELVKIKSLTKNAKYLNDELEKVVKNNVIFYEKSNGNYIERYALGRSLNGLVETFDLDAFYPKDLEKNMSKRIADVLNTNYKYDQELLKNPNKVDEDFDDNNDNSKKISGEDKIDFDRED